MGVSLVIFVGLLGHFFKKELLALLFVSDNFPCLIEDVNLRMSSSMVLHV